LDFSIFSFLFFHLPFLSFFSQALDLGLMKFTKLRRGQERFFEEKWLELADSKAGGSHQDIF
jgi:hypothetical protein